MPIDYPFMTGMLQPAPVPQPGTIQAMQTPTVSNIGPLANIAGADITTANSGGIASALMGGATDPVGTANAGQGGFMDKIGGTPGLSFMLASLGKALSARDPNSWQHQLSGTVATGASNAMIQRGALIAALQQKMVKKPNIGDLIVPKSRFGGTSKLPSLLSAGGGISASFSE